MAITRSFSLAVLLLAGSLYAPSREGTPLTLPASVRVRLFSGEQPSEIRVTAADGQTSLINAQQATPFHSSGPVTIHRLAGSDVRLQYPLEVTSARGVLLIVTDVPFEDYVAAVLAGESSNFRSDESLKALAVAARSYAAHFLARHQSEGFNFCDTTHCQDFRITAVTDRLRKAANDTRGQVLLYDEQPIAAYYHQDCGGITEAQAPYLTQLKDPFCVSHGRMRWTTELTVSDLHSALGIKDVSSIEIIERTNSRRAQRLRLDGSEMRVLDAETFRLSVGRTLGWDKIRSDLYEIHRAGDRFIFDGYGAGHGIGLCQDGAAAMGEQGFSYKEILAYYYPNTRISQLR